MNTSLRYLNYFRIAAEEGHFGRAAERLHISQPALSRQIGNLESDLGVVLFQRLPRGVRLTEAGRTFLSHTTEIVHAYERACEHTREASENSLYRLQLGVTDFALNYPVVARSLARFRARAPDVNLRLSVTWSSELQKEALLTERIEGGFLYYFDGAMSGRLTYYCVAEETFLLALPQDHPLASLTEIPLARLARMPFVWVKRDTLPELYDQLIAACRDAKMIPRIVQDAPTEVTLLQLVSLHMGLAFIRSSLAKQVPPGLVVRPVSDLKLIVRLGFARLSQNSSNILLDYVRQLGE